MLMARCPRCGQSKIVGEVLIGADGRTVPPGPCDRCLAAEYGGGESHAAERLFEPAPAPMPGQESMTLE